MGKKSPPPAPDYVGIANQQAQASQNLAQQQTTANRPDVFTPWGSQTWQQNGDQWASQISLSPQQQAALDSQMAVTQGRSQAAQGLLGQSVQAFQNPLSYGGVAEGATRLTPQQVGQGGAGEIQGRMSATAGDWRQRGQDAALQFMRPQQEQRQQALESQLSNMGLTRGSQAWNAEMQRNADQTTRDQLQAFGAGQSEAGMLFGQDLQSGQFANQAQNQGFGQMAQAAQQNNAANQQAGAFNQQLRQQQIAEMMQQRNQPLNELNALLTGQQVSSPNMPSFSQAGRGETPQLLNAANMGYDAQMDAYNARQGGIGGAMGGLFGLGSAAMGSGGWGGLFSLGSDPAYKTDVRRIGTHERLGVGIYRFMYAPEYAMKWGYGPQVGVMADELQAVAPELISTDADGHTVVDYRGVW